MNDKFKFKDCEVKKKATYEEISIECAKHALDFLHYIATFHNLRQEQLYEVRKFIHIISGYNKALKNYREQKDVIGAIR